MAAVADMEDFVEGTPEAMEEMLLPRVDISGIATESDEGKVNGIVFELYKEALGVVNLVAHLLDETSSASGGLSRNQAVCAGLLIRMGKFMLVIAQISASTHRSEVVQALSRCIFESAINLEFLVCTDDEKFFDQFVRFSFSPERELFDTIQANIAARGGEIWPIENRMLGSIEDVCAASGVKITEVDRKHGDWGGGLRERLKAINKESAYVAVLRIPSHAVHGTWVDLYKNHLEYDPNSGRYQPDSRFSRTDARSLAPTALMALEPVTPYLERFFGGIPEAQLLLERVDDLSRRLVEADAAHEKLLAARPPK